jgi:hypothetical protein
MKRIAKLGAIGTLVLVLAIHSFATDSRKIVLTGTVYHEYSPLGMVITSVDALLNPTFMLDHPNFVNVDMDSATLTYSGYGFIKLEALNLPGMLGLQIGKRYGSYRNDIWVGPGQDINDLNGLVAPLCGQANVGVDGVNVTNLNGVRSFGLYYALPLGDKLKAGFGLNYVGRGVSGNRINDPQSISTEMDDTVEKKISTMMFRAGAGYTMLNDKLNLNLDIGFGKPKYNYEYTISGTARLPQAQVQIWMPTSEPVMCSATTRTWSPIFSISLTEALWKSTRILLLRTMGQPTSDLRMGSFFSWGPFSMETAIILAFRRALPKANPLLKRVYRRLEWISKKIIQKLLLTLSLEFLLKNACSRGSPCGHLSPSRLTARSR